MAFPIQDLPAEVIGLVLSHLIKSAEYAGSDDVWWDTSHLRSARLVCRQWNALAFPLLFQTVELFHKYKRTNRSYYFPNAETIEEKAENSNYENQFPVWNAMMDCEAVRNVARCAIINSTPEVLNEWQHDHGQDEYTWSKWQEIGKWSSFTDSINRIKELPRLTDVTIKFSDKCRGEESECESKNDPARPILESGDPCGSGYSHVVAPASPRECC